MKKYPTYDYKLGIKKVKKQNKTEKNNNYRYILINQEENYNTISIVNKNQFFYYTCYCKEDIEKMNR